MLHVGKIPKNVGQILAKFSKILAGNFANFGKNQQKSEKNFQQNISAILMKKMRLENGAKECIV